MTLEETIHSLAEKGNLSHISLAMNSSHTQWRASYAPAKTFGVSFAEDPDPVKALMKAFGKKPTSNLNPRVEPIQQAVVEVEVPTPDEDIDALM